MSDAYAGRRERLREHCSATGADAALITRAANVRYLTGCPPCGATLLLTRERVLLALPDDLPPDDTGEHLIAEDVTQVPVAAGADTALAAAAAAARLRVSDLAVEEHDLTVSRHRAVAGLAEGVRLADLAQAVERLRVVKDEHEIADLRIAAEIADQALGELLESILVGRTERHLAMELERRMIDHGADRAAFPVSVGTGSHSGQQAHQPTDRRVEEGDFLTVVLGAQYRGYGVSTARTFVIGAAPRPGRSSCTGWSSGRSGPGGRRSGPGSSSTYPTRRRGRSSRRPGTPRARRTRSATVSGWRSGRRRASVRRTWVNWTAAYRSPSARGSTSLARAGSGSRTRSSCAPSKRADPSCSPSPPRSSSPCDPRLPGRLPQAAGRTPWFLDSYIQE